MTRMDDRSVLAPRRGPVDADDRLLFWFALQAIVLVPVAIGPSVWSEVAWQPWWITLPQAALSIGVAWLIARSLRRLWRLPRPVSAVGYIVLGAVLALLASGPLLEGTRPSTTIFGAVYLALALVLWSLLARAVLDERRRGRPS